MKRIYRSKTDKIIGGVCGGIGKYFTVDPVLIRLIMLILVLITGFGLLGYIIAWIIIPTEPVIVPESEVKTEPEVKTEN